MAKMRLGFLIVGGYLGMMALMGLITEKRAKAEVSLSPSTSSSCTVTIGAIGYTLPYTISSPGVYCLASDLIYSGTGDAITINNTGNTGAVLDFGGFHLGYTGASSVAGVNVTGNYNYVIRNGLISGFYTGIRFSGGGNTLVKDMRIVAASNGVSISSGPVSIDHCFIQNVAFTGIIVYSNSSHISISNTIIMDESNSYTGDAGIDFESTFTGDGIVDNNQFFNTAGPAINNNAATKANVILRNNLASSAGMSPFVNGTHVIYGTGFDTNQNH